MVGLVGVAWIIFLGQPTAVSTHLRHFFVRLVTPLGRLGDWIPTVKSRRQLQAANQALRAENTRLRQLLHAVEETEAENLRLQTLLALKQRPGVTTVAARVIGRDASNWWQSLQLDRGSADGVVVNQPVLTADGLVGKTIEVSRSESRVLLVLDPNCMVSALLQDTREPGVVAGRAAAFQSRPRCEMRYVNRAATVTKGTAVISSGLGGIFPKGIRIGTVVNSRLDDETGLYQTLELEPAVDFNRLEEALIRVRQE